MCYCYCQARFHPKETISAVHDVVNGALDLAASPDVAFELFMTPPRKVLQADVSLRAAGLGSARAKIYLAWLVPPAPHALDNGAYFAEQFRAQLRGDVSEDVLRPQVASVELVEGSASKAQDLGGFSWPSHATPPTSVNVLDASVYLCVFRVRVCSTKVE